MVSVVATLHFQSVSQLQIWHVHVIGPQDVPYFKVILNSQ